jgi:hypothetical protein
MIRRAVASSFERLADALSPKPQSQAQEEERAELVARVAELEAEREWKPWPPEVSNGRRIVFCCPARGWCFVTVASAGISSMSSWVTRYPYSHPCFYRELGPVPGDDHG